MPSFKKLTQLSITADRTATLVLYDLEGEPELILSPDTEVNKPYFNAMLKRQRKNIGRVRAQNFSAKMTQENRDDDRRLYGEHVIRGWNRVVDDTGEDVEFSVENAQAFFGALPDHIFDDVRMFCTAPRNFIEELADPEDISGN